MDEIDLFYQDLKNKDANRRTLNSELIGARVSYKNKGLNYYVIKEIARFHNEKENNILNVGGDLGLDLILLKENSISFDKAISLDVFIPEDKLDFPTYIKGNAYELTNLFNKEEFNIVLLKEVIEHLFDPDRAISQIKEIMKDDGILIVTTPNLSSMLNRLLLLFGYLPMAYEVSTKRNFGKPKKYNDREGAAGHIRLFTFRALEQFLKYYGFKIERAYTIPASPCVGHRPGDVPENSLVLKLDKLFSKINKRWGSSTIMVVRKLK